MPKKRKILIVDDDKVIAQTLKIKFSNAGHEVAVVHGGAEALVELEANSYEVLLLDIIMPEPDGWQVLEILQQKDHGLKIIVCSNLEQDEDISKAKSLGAHRYIVKTRSDLSDVVQTIEEI